MGCRSDYMEPTSREQYNQHTAKLYLYAMEQLLKANPSDTQRVFHRDHLGQVKAVANQIHAFIDYTLHLCALIRDLTETERDQLVYNARDPLSRRLADWWEEHKQVDDKRIRETKIEVGQFAHEITRLADELPPELRDKIIGLTNQMHSVLSHQD